MTHRLIFTTRARNDLVSITSYNARENPERAMAYVRELEECCAAISRRPNAFAIIPRYRDKAIRRVVYGNHLICYRVDTDTVTVLRVLYSSMDTDRILG
ncbi:MAG: type II toxin-antitoxin system RelE/ParE family toxin [Bosea sp. (in: a-proteobacteria)]